MYGLSTLVGIVDQAPLCCDVLAMSVHNLVKVGAAGRRPPNVHTLEISNFCPLDPSFLRTVPPCAVLLWNTGGILLHQEQPKKVAVVGAGYIAVELAGVFQSLGTDTTLLVRGNRPLRPFDSSIVEVLTTEMEKSGLKLKTHSTPKVSMKPLASRCLVAASYLLSQ